MITKSDLEEAMKECLEEPVDYRNCQKLATFCTIYDHFYTIPEPRVATVDEELVGRHGESDFLSAIAGTNAKRVWEVMDELMDALKVVNPKLYDSVMRRLL